jgi:hypothetical protein
MLFVGPATAGVALPDDESYGPWRNFSPAYPISDVNGFGCDDANRIFGYNVASNDPGPVGIRAIDGAVVDARNNIWQSSPRTSVGVGSFIASGTVCTSIGVGSRGERPDAGTSCRRNVYGAAAGRREPPSPPLNRASSRIGEGLKPLTIR